MLSSISIRGIRSFKEERSIKFSQPNGERGSGLTIIVGPNNSGKSTMIESLHQLTKYDPIFEESFRNKKAADLARISAKFASESGKIITIESTGKNTSNVIRNYNEGYSKLYIVSSQKRFSTFFSNHGSDKINYNLNSIQTFRDYQPQNQQFGQRLVNIVKDNKKELFDKCLSKMLPNIPDWEIESENNNAYLKFIFEDEITHNSMSSGDGIINVFSIADALYDPHDTEITVVIDEPEISLHPDIQRNVMELIMEESRNRQIIVTTHSPYFVEWECLQNGGIIYRFFKQKGQTHFGRFSEENIGVISSLLKDRSNARTLGIEAKEILFLNPEKAVIVTEGQEDVLYLELAFKKIDAGLLNTFSLFGWGAGGAGNIVKIQSLLHDLGYSRVIGFFDSDKKKELDKAVRKFPEYINVLSPAEDIRKTNDKHGEKIEPLIINETSDINPEHETVFFEKLSMMKEYAKQQSTYKPINFDELIVEKKDHINDNKLRNETPSINKITIDLENITKISFPEGGGGFIGKSENRIIEEYTLSLTNRYKIMA